MKWGLCQLASCVLMAAAAVDGRKPHIVLLVVDDLGRSDHQVYGPSDIKLPNFEQAAASGVRLDTYYTQQVCSPTRSALMTGLFPFRTGLQHTTTLMPGTTAHLPLDTETLPENLRSHGYKTAMLGKWHLGNAKWKYTPYGRGFDVFHGYLQGQEDYFTKQTVETISAKGINGYDFFHNDEIDWSAQGGYSADQYPKYFQDIVAQYNATEQDKASHPLFTYFPWQTVHVPLQAKRAEEECAHIPDKWRGVFCSMLVEFDRGFGSMISTLKEHGMYDDTLILVTTDNGGMVRFNKNSDGKPVTEASMGSNAPLRGSKANLYEGGVRGTAFITGGKNAFPQEARGTQYKGLMHAVDLFAIASAAGRDALLKADQDATNIDGINLLPNMIPSIEAKSGLLPARKSVPININYDGLQFTAIRFGDWKLIIGRADLITNFANDGWWPIGGGDPEMPPEGDKYAAFHLFDLAQDNEERVNLALQKPKIVAQGIALIRKYMKEGYQNPQFNLPHLRGLPLLHNGTWSPFLSLNEHCIKEPVTARRHILGDQLDDAKSQYVFHDAQQISDLDHLQSMARRLHEEEGHAFLQLSEEEQARMGLIL